MGRGRDRLRKKQAEKQKATEQPVQQQQKVKIGAGALGAAYRQGLKELGQVMPAFPASGIQPVEEANAIWGANPTPRDAYEQKHGVADKQAKAAEKQKQIEPGD